MANLPIDLSTYNYVTGHTNYTIELSQFKGCASIDLEINSNEDVSLEAIRSGDGEICHLAKGRNFNFKRDIIHVDALKLRVKKSARLAYKLRASEHGGFEKLSPIPMVIQPASNEFHLTSLIRQELARRLDHMGLTQEDTDDILDEDDFDYEDEETEADFPTETEFTEMEDEPDLGAEDPPDPKTTDGSEPEPDVEPPGTIPPETPEEPGLPL